MLRMQYSMALVRLVNGIADSSQKGKVAASVASLASTAGLPRSLVDLRHEATHNELPSLAVLRLAGGQGLDWLRAHYWRRQAAQLEASLGQVAALAREYLGLHLAAASKTAAAVAASQSAALGGDSSDEGGGGAAAAAVAGGGGAADGGAGYDVAEARRRRQALITELRATVPRPAAPLLVDALGGEARRAAEGGASEEVLSRALAHTVSHLAKEWLQLPALLLQAAARGLGAGGGGGGGGGGGEAAAAEGWAGGVRVLLPPSGPTWAPSERQIAHLLAACLPAYTAAARDAALQPGGVATAGRAEALRALIRALMERLQSRQLYARCSALLASIGQLLPPAAGGGGQAARPTGERSGGGTAQKRAREPTEPAAAEAAACAGGRKRWRRAQAWDACAIGMLPSALDPNGQLPPLDPPAGAAPQRGGNAGATPQAAPGPELPSEEEEDGGGHAEDAAPDAPCAVPPPRRAPPASISLLL